LPHWYDLARNSTTVLRRLFAVSPTYGANLISTTAPSSYIPRTGMSVAPCLLARVVNVSSASPRARKRSTVLVPPSMLYSGRLEISVHAVQRVLWSQCASRASACKALADVATKLNVSAPPQSGRSWPARHTLLTSCRECETRFASPTIRSRRRPLLLEMPTPRAQLLRIAPSFASSFWT
jgi:hypothetical protein